MENERAKWRLRAARWRARAAACLDTTERAACENIAFEYELLASNRVDHLSSEPVLHISKGEEGQ
jgi:hypothetical protein